MAEGKATPADADLILKLYDLRREPELRRARNWCLTEFFPESLDDILALYNQPKSQQNAWFRQVLSYWEMACALVNHGAIDADLFLDASGGEMHILYAKLRPFLPQLRQHFEAPRMLQQMEGLLESHPRSREIIERMQSRMAQWKELIKGQSAATG